jgi:hypothetical protein
MPWYVCCVLSELGAGVLGEVSDKRHPAVDHRGHVCTNFRVAHHASKVVIVFRPKKVPIALHDLIVVTGAILSELACVYCVHDRFRLN